MIEKRKKHGIKRFFAKYFELNTLSRGINTVLAGANTGFHKGGRRGPRTC